MEQSYNPSIPVDARYGVQGVPAPHCRGKAVSWGAIIAGTFAILATSIVLMTLGSGLGLSMASPYEGEGMTAASVGISAIIWLIVIQWMSSGLGGYIAGRLRNRWEGLHGDEVFFRDSAHGITAWAVACVFSVAILVSAVSSVVGAGTQAASVVAAGAAQNGEDMGQALDNGADYYIDTLYRTSGPNSASASETVRDETARIFMKGMSEEGISEPDKAYLSQLVANSTKLDQVQASARVNEAVAKMEETKQKAIETTNEARKHAAKLSILTALAMVIGAFIAGVTAILGGRHRDEY